MKNTIKILFFILLFPALGWSQAKDSLASYTLPIPTGWETEKFALPPDFAPSITYKGVEDIRFAPGWGDTTSAEHWCYAFLWWLEGKQQPDAASIETSLNAYYNGLVGRNIESRKIPADKVFPVKTTIKKVKTQARDVTTFSGTIYMLNYLKQEPIALNCVVHLKKCNSKDRTAVFFEISPQPLQHPVWKKLQEVSGGFSCLVE